MRLFCAVAGFAASLWIFKLGPADSQLSFHSMENSPDLKFSNATTVTPPLEGLG
jgi:hypothetical protein